MDLAQLDAFAKVVQSGSFTAAAALRGTDKARLSRTVAALEQELGTRLLERSTRSLRLTESGRSVLERAHAILGAADDLVQFTRALQAEPQGVLRLTCNADFALVAANRWIAGYLARWPKVSVDVDVSARRADLVHEGFDLALRIGALDDSRLAARTLGELRYGLFASPGYLKGAGRLRTPDDLRAHPLLMFTTGSGRSGWTLRRRGRSRAGPATDTRAAGPAIDIRGAGPAANTRATGLSADTVRIERAGRVRAGSVTLLLDACRAGLGVARLPLLLAATAPAGSLQPVLPGWEPQPAPVHAVFPSNRYLAPKVRAFIDHALADFEPQAEWRPRAGPPVRPAPEGLEPPGSAGSARA